MVPPFGRQALPTFLTKHTTMEATTGRTEGKAKTMWLYGDLVRSLIAVIAAPFISYQYTLLPEDHPKKQWALFAAVAITTTGVFQHLSWWIGNTVLLYVASLCHLSFFVYIEMIEWPLEGECTIAQNMVGTMLMINANVGVNPLHKAVLMLISVCAGYLVISVSPFVRLEDELTFLLGGSMGNFILLYAFSRGAHQVDSVKAARLIISVIFLFVIAQTMYDILTVPGGGREGCITLIKEAFFVCLGMAATGVLQQEIVAKESLEVLVQERTVEIRQQAQELHLVGLALQASETATAVTDARQTIIWQNPAMGRLCQQPTGGGFSTDGHSLVHALGLSGSSAQKLQTSFDNGYSPQKMEEEIVVGDATLTVQVSQFPESVDESSPALQNKCNNKEQKQNRFVVVLKDITELRTREKAEKAAQQEALVAQAMMDTVEVVTHECRTPLQGIMGITSMLLGEAESLPTDVQESLALIMASSGLLLTLVNNMLDVRKCDANMMSEFQLVPIPLKPPMEDAAAFCRPLATISNVKLELEFGNSSQYAIIESDALRLQQVLINLLSNAVKYTSVGSVIRIAANIKTISEVESLIGSSLAAGVVQTGRETASKGDTKVMVFSVSDQGKGIAPGQEKRLFGKFSQLDSTQTHTLGGNSVGQPSGTGLGLNLCVNFVEIMKGNIWVANNSDCGACFSFYLPLVLETNGEVREERPPLPQQTNSTTNGARPKNPTAPLVSHRSASASKYRVLLVDDTLINRKVFDRMLNRVGVGLVTTVESGVEALKALEAGDYNLVITDIQMPGMSGTQLSEAIHLNRNIAKLPLVVGLTAETSRDLYERCKACGIVDVMHKPMTVDEMKDYFEKVVDSLTPHYESLVRVQ
jgi:signal transduction histidine kinase/ActR/RegA family two-component response regulator